MPFSSRARKSLRAKSARRRRRRFADVVTIALGGRTITGHCYRSNISLGVFAFFADLSGLWPLNTPWSPDWSLLGSGHHKTNAFCAFSTAKPGKISEKRQNSE